MNKLIHDDIEYYTKTKDVLICPKQLNEKLNVDEINNKRVKMAFNLSHEIGT